MMTEYIINLTRDDVTNLQRQRSLCSSLSSRRHSNYSTATSDGHIRMYKRKQQKKEGLVCERHPNPHNKSQQSRSPHKRTSRSPMRIRKSQFKKRALIVCSDIVLKRGLNGRYLRTVGVLGDTSKKTLSSKYISSHAHRRKGSYAMTELSLTPRQKSSYLRKDFSSKATDTHILGKDAELGTGDHSRGHKVVSADEPSAMSHSNRADSSDAFYEAQKQFMSKQHETASINNCSRRSQFQAETDTTTTMRDDAILSRSISLKRNDNAIRETSLLPQLIWQPTGTNPQLGTGGVALRILRSNYLISTHFNAVEEIRRFHSVPGHTKKEDPDGLLAGRSKPRHKCRDTGRQRSAIQSTFRRSLQSDFCAPRMSTTLSEQTTLCSIAAGSESQSLHYQLEFSPNGFGDPMVHATRDISNSVNHSRIDSSSSSKVVEPINQIRKDVQDESLSFFNEVEKTSSSGQSPSPSRCQKPNGSEIETSLTGTPESSSSTPSERKPLLTLLDSFFGIVLEDGRFSRHSDIRSDAPTQAICASDAGAEAIFLSAPSEPISSVPTANAFESKSQTSNRDKTKKTTLPTVLFDATHYQVHSEILRCSICLEDFQHLDKRSFLPCLHSFHKKCINKWLHRSSLCPICLLDIRKLLKLARLRNEQTTTESKTDSFCTVAANLAQRHNDIHCPDTFNSHCSQADQPQCDQTLSADSLASRSFPAAPSISQGQSIHNLQRLSEIHGSISSTLEYPQQLLAARTSSNVDRYSNGHVSLNAGAHLSRAAEQDEVSVVSWATNERQTRISHRNDLPVAFRGSGRNRHAILSPPSSMRSTLADASNNSRKYLRQDPQSQAVRCPSASRTRTLPPQSQQRMSDHSLSVSHYSPEQFELQGVGGNRSGLLSPSVITFQRESDISIPASDKPHHGTSSNQQIQHQNNFNQYETTRKCQTDTIYIMPTKNGPITQAKEVKEPLFQRQHPNSQVSSSQTSTVSDLFCTEQSSSRELVALTYQPHSASPGTLHSPTPAASSLMQSDYRAIQARRGFTRQAHQNQSHRYQKQSERNAIR